MNLALNIVSAGLIIACLVYIFIKRKKNIAILIMSSIILAVLLGQIVLDEVVRAQMLALDSVENFIRTSNIVKYLNWGKAGLIFILALYCSHVNYEANNTEVGE